MPARLTENAPRSFGAKRDFLSIAASGYEIDVQSFAPEACTL